MTAIVLSPSQVQNQLVSAIRKMAPAPFLITLEKARGRSGACKARSLASLSGASSLPANDWLSEVAVEPDQVRKFCETNRIMSGAVAAVSMAERFFSAIDTITLRVEQDPESDAQWLMVDVCVTDESINLLECYDRFIQEWTKIPNAVARQLIHLTFSYA